MKRDGAGRANWFSDMTIYFAVMSLKPPDSFETMQGIPAVIKVEGLAGFLPVFKTREEAEEAYPGDKIARVATVASPEESTDG